MVNYWIFVMVEYNDYNASISDGLKRIEEEKIWKIGERTANRVKIRKGDLVVIYTSGEGNRNFIASAILDSGFINEGRPYYGHVKLTNIQLFTKKIPLKKILNGLDFIKNKTRYGSHFQSGIIAISEKDYKTIIKKTRTSSRT